MHKCDIFREIDACYKSTKTSSMKNPKYTINFSNTNGSILEKQHNDASLFYGEIQLSAFMKWILGDHSFVANFYMCISVMSISLSLKNYNGL